MNLKSEASDGQTPKGVFLNKISHFVRTKLLFSINSFVANDNKVDLPIEFRLNRVLLFHYNTLHLTIINHEQSHGDR